MSPPSKDSAITGPPGAALGQALYASATTRVSGLAETSAAGRVVFKEYLGPRAAQRLRNERDLLARLAGIEGVVQLAQGAKRPDALTLRHPGGTTLAQVLLAGRCDMAAVLAVGAQLARTLAEVHRAGVIHRDVNPSNILLSPGQQAVLIDFDQAVLADQQVAVAPEGQIVGTLGYVAPEQTGRTGRAVDQRADLYALGATLYEMSTARLPFEAKDTLELIRDHLVREPAAPSLVDPHVPRALSDIILRLLAKAPEQRYQSAEGLWHDLTRLQEMLTRGGEGRFALGERDFAAQLAAPARLVGRDTESARLRIALEEALHTPRRTVLVEGPAGVGKSALINQLRPMVAASGGWFVHGKFDQYQKDGATTGPLMQALGSIGRLLLAQSTGALAAQRRRILDSLGRRAGLVTRLLPEFALLLGAQQPPPEVDSQQAELQLQQAVVDLLGTIASPERPLVIVLDDLQWAGPMPLRAFERLMVEPGLRGVLLVGAYRADELEAAHVLTPMLARWRQRTERALLEIGLTNLTPDGIGELIAQMLRLARPRADALGRAVSALTGGNPFDTVELINALRKEGVLSLREQGWHWDEVAIRHFVGRGNVVDLLAARIARLPAASRELVEFMSCLGNSVECKLLCVAAGLDDDELRQRVRAPLEDGLLVSDQNIGPDSVKFRHDRVQQAVLGTMDDAQRSQRQLAMARRLARGPAFGDEAAQQYLACLDLLQAQGDAQEQRRCAQLFHELARKLSATARHSLAERYLAAATALMTRIDDPADAPLRGAINAMRHAALYNLGRMDEADPLFAAIEAHTADPLDLVKPTCLQMRSLETRGRTDGAVELGMRLLAQFGVGMPQDYTVQDMDQRLDALTEWVRQDSQLDHSKRAQIEEPRLQAVATLLSRIARPAPMRFDTKQMSWLLLESQRLWAGHGPCPELLVSVARICNLLISRRQDYRTAFELGRHVLEVGQALGYEPQTSEARGVFATFVSCWFEPLEAAYHHLARAMEGERDDLSHACYLRTSLNVLLLDFAPSLDVCRAEMDAALVMSQSAGNIHAAALQKCSRQLLNALSGQTRESGSFDDHQFDEDSFLAQQAQHRTVRATLHARRALCALLLGDWRELDRHTTGAMALLDMLPGHYWSLHIHLFLALARAWQVQATAFMDAANALAELDDCRSWLAARAADQPYNCLHLLALVQAEQAWALGQWWEAATAFDAAVLEAQNRSRPWHRALITERAGLFHLARGLLHAGRRLLTDARDQYLAWGATAKVNQMQRTHAFLSAPAVGPSPGGFSTDASRKGDASVLSDALDLVGVLRASQALSSETSLEQLTSRVTEVLASLSGATKVVVLSWSEGQWWLLAPAPGEPSMSVAQAAERGLLPLSAVGYAERTGETLVVDDAPRDDRFARDPYFEGVPLCSLLLVPIAGQGGARAMLLLENRLGRAAFNAQRLDAVMLIAGQLAVSLSNAQLYESLEQRVQARTRELEQAQAQLVATARRAGKAEIANNVLHNVGNVLNSINVSAKVMRKAIVNSKIEGLTRAVDLMNQHAHDLGHFIDSDPRGKALPPYLNELVRTLRLERQETLSDLDRLSRGVDHVTYVITTQQSHAGPSSVQELARPQDVLEDALHLSAEAIARSSVTVVRHYEDVPATALDRQRLVQILVNLIGNATQAMEGVPQQTRQLTLATGLVQGEHGRRLRISVQDQGVGIPPENLKRIFSHGFTTRKSGHGFGLHSSALAAVEIGGRLTVQSDGPGQGAVFSVELPLDLGASLPAEGAAGFS